MVAFWPRMADWPLLSVELRASILLPCMNSAPVSVPPVGQIGAAGDRRRPAAILARVSRAIARRVGLDRVELPNRVEPTVALGRVGRFRHVGAGERNPCPVVAAIGRIIHRRFAKAGVVDIVLGGGPELAASGHG